MGLNLMSGRRRVEIVEQARKGVVRQLDRLRSERVRLPGRSRRRTRVVPAGGRAADARRAA
jgi:hypothetical protein